MTDDYPCFNALEIMEAQSNLRDLITQMERETANEMGFTWRTSWVAPNTYDRVKREFHVCLATGMAFRVSGEHSHQTIYADPLTNYRFRFVHDTRHAWLDADFSLKGEQVVAARHLARAKAAGYDETSVEYRLLEADTLGQAVYVSLYGTFPRNQLRFDLRCLEQSIEEAVDIEYAVEQQEQQ